MMIADILHHSIQQGRAYRLEHPHSTLKDAQNEARRRWPEEPHIGLCRAFFLSGWAQQAPLEEHAAADPTEP